jgi:hypothetical protein
MLFFKRYTELFRGQYAGGVAEVLLPALKNVRPGIRVGLIVLVIALRPQTPKHIKGGWSHYTDTSEPVDGNGAQNMSLFNPALNEFEFQLYGV